MPVLATYIVALSWKQRVLATAGLNAVVALAFAVFGHHASVQIVRAIFIECGCDWFQFGSAA